MTLLSIIITLGIERFYRVLDDYRNLDWFARWSNWVAEHRSINSSRTSVIVTLLTLLLPLLLVHQLATWMADGGWLPELLFNMLILVLSLGPKDLRTQVETVIESWTQDDVEGGILHAEGLLEGELPEEKRGVIRKLTEAVLTEANPRIFTVLFWFILFGPAAALLVRLSLTLMELQKSEDDDFAGSPTSLLIQINHFLAWPAAHLVAISYAVVGDFSSAMKRIIEHGGDWQRNRVVMLYAGLGAIRLDPLQEDQAELSVEEEGQESAELQEVWDALEMVRRAEFAWIALLALLILTGAIHT
ncbi:MAG: regulatory signaling modulator protein AmpE [Gammaproteobacteria bacterium]|jgi:membrane protein required for beta-lactamase induction|nr:regulatory signaling modulator protein AmpE [Gammaproteobacteria bacterium]MBT3488203.1 regulatory signaling modulator protein AmpE [Gammaproteobacteria bacterium]MBT3719030.1 regulatory signaling modulator protein AmpE [Gammaproteobacteria bacterium]MBT3843884.1 regulatory signaling modulator protein AmpE [Gammaproteobacteria bacterium]MBT3892446.1 regulatory signaling modulator protein AmpE [Gammaproteobacteria bacterium]